LITWSKGNEVWALAFLQTDIVEAVSATPPKIQSVLAQFQEVFSDPKTLPPSRPYDHAITLKPGSVPLNCRPYRYSPEHKSKIEKQIKQMLKAGVISPSMSPFASPVLLVLKSMDPRGFA
jgi:hypothetical protein